MCFILKHRAIALLLPLCSCRFCPGDVIPSVSKLGWTFTRTHICTPRAHLQYSRPCRAQRTVHVVNLHACMCVRVREAGVQAERSQRLDSQKAVCNSICNLGAACHLPRLSSGVTLSVSFSLIQFSSRKHLTLPSAELFLSAKRGFFVFCPCYFNNHFDYLLGYIYQILVSQATSRQKPSQYFCPLFHNEAIWSSSINCE